MVMDGAGGESPFQTFTLQTKTGKNGALPAKKSPNEVRVCSPPARIILFLLLFLLPCLVFSFPCGMPWTRHQFPA